MAGLETSASRLAPTLQGRDELSTLSRGTTKGGSQGLSDEQLHRFNWSSPKNGYDMGGIPEPPTVAMIDAAAADQSVHCIKFFQSGKYWWNQYPGQENSQASPSDEF